MVRALEMVAPGTALREGLDNIQSAHTGGLIVIGDADELAFLFSGGIKLDLDYSPAFLYELAKMDGAIVLSSLLFAAMHVPDKLPVFISLFVGGMLLATMRWLSGSIVPTILMHATWNFGIGILMALGV